MSTKNDIHGREARGNQRAHILPSTCSNGGAMDISLWIEWGYCPNGMLNQTNSSFMTTTSGSAAQRRQYSARNSYRPIPARSFHLRDPWECCAGAQTPESRALIFPRRHLFGMGKQSGAHSESRESIDNHGVRFRLGMIF